jgi:hypothetical protein
MDKANLKDWQKELISYEQVSGTPGQAGAVTKLVYKMTTIFETIVSNNLPAEINAEYEHKRGNKTVMFHKASNQFTSINGNKTLYEMDTEVTKVIGFFPKLLMKLMSGSISKYYQNQLNQFKAFAEKQNT